jgi:hypothetical protein
MNQREGIGNGGISAQRARLQDKIDKVIEPVSLKD